MDYDIFISHCHKDKLKYVDNLAEELKKIGIKLFYDSNDITWGDNIKDRIDHGLKNCKLAIVVISNKYFGREWTEYEIEMLLKRQCIENRKFILPILHQIKKRDLEKHYPQLRNISFKYSKSQSTKRLAEEAKNELEKIKGDINK